MKKVKIKYALIVFICLFTGIGLTACSSWTEPESVKINMPTPADVNSAVYAKYLESLKAYRQTNHKLVYTWFNNTHEEVVQNRSQHIDALPDSIDYVVLMNPDSLADREIQEIETVRAQKGMQVLLSVDYDAIKAAYDASIPVGDPEDAAAFTKLLTEQVNTRLALVDKYNYDGIIFKYDGISTLHLDAADAVNIPAYQATYLSLVQTWYTSHSNKLLVFQGQPENLLDMALLSSCKNIIIDCTNAISMDALDYNIELTLAQGIPTDRFVALVSTISLDPGDLKTGYFNSTSDPKVLAIPRAAIWVAQSSTNRYTKAGLGILNVQNDYFNPAFTYSNIRGAINTLNPSPNE